MGLGLTHVEEDWHDSFGITRKLASGVDDQGPNDPKLYWKGILTLVSHLWGQRTEGKGH